MTANDHWEEDCYNCMYHYHDYWNCPGEDEPCDEYVPNPKAEAEEEDEP